MNNINLLSEQFRRNLLNLINDNQLPASLTYYILKDVFVLLERGYFDSINEMNNNESQEEKGE